MLARDREEIALGCAQVSKFQIRHKTYDKLTRPLALRPPRLNCCCGLRNGWQLEPLPMHGRSPIPNMKHLTAAVEVPATQAPALSIVTAGQAR
jgi:hypothetical protein